jgi:hypothetical protein
MSNRHGLGRVLTLVVLCGLGCQHIGPRTIKDDRIPYNEAIAQSWKQQTLLNLVRLRYGDLPEFVDVSSIVNGYERANVTSGSLGTDILPHRSTDSVIALGLGGSHSLIDRPTISYAPQGNSEFVRNLTSPLTPLAILNLIESGAPADVVFEFTVESINGIRNRGFTGEYQEGDPEFQTIIRTLRRAQDSGLTSFRVKSSPSDPEQHTLLVIKEADIPEELQRETKELRQLLKLDQDSREFEIVFGLLPQNRHEIALRTRNVIRIMNYLSLYVQVPICHLAEGRALDWGEVMATEEPPFTVYSGCEPPEDCFTSVEYAGHWFWIDHRDFSSKRAMSYLKVLLALVDTQKKDAAPALMIRAN